jgi:hypothetical protein
VRLVIRCPRSPSRRRPACCRHLWRQLRDRQRQFSIDPKLCDEPRVDPLLTVVYATKNAAGSVVQAIAGPFDLGRPRGCPKSADNGKWRIPQEKEESPL